MILLTGDLHLSENPREAYRFQFMEWLIAEVRRQSKIEYLIILGDLTDEKDRHAAALTNEICRYIHELSKMVTVIISKGNHDYLLADCPFFQFLSRIKNVHWVNDPRTMDLDGIGALFLPHTRQYERDWAGWLNQRHDIIFAHNTFAGAMDNGHELKGIPLSVFPKNARVISGDIHTPQTIALGTGGSLIYVGAPYTIKFGDSHDGRVLLLNTNMSMKSIPYHGPQKRLFDIDTVGQLKKLEITKGDLVKIRIALKSDQYDEWPKMRETIRDWAAERGVALTLSPIMERKPRTYVKTDTKSDEQLVRTFAKRTDMSKSILGTGLEFLK